MNFKKIRKLLFVINSNNSNEFSLVLALLVLSSIFEIVGISSIMPLISSITDISNTLENKYLLLIYNKMNFNDSEFRIFIGLSSFTLLFISSLLTICTNKWMLTFGNNIGKEVALELYKKFISESYLFHTKINSSELTKNITLETSRYTQNVFLPTLRLISKVIFLGLTFLFLLFVEPVLAITAILSISFVYFVIYFSLRNKLSSNGQVISQSNKKRFKVLNESFLGIKETKIMALEDGYIHEFEQHSAAISSATASSQSISIIPKSIIEFLLFGSLIFTILYLVSTGNISDYLPLLTLFLFMGYRTLPALQVIYNSLVLIRSNESSIKSIMYEKPIDTSLYHGNKEKKQFHQKISINNVSFSYDNSEHFALKNINLNFNKNQLIAIVGLSGSGKTTLIDLIIGLIQPTKGEVTVDGQVFNDREGLFSYVPQSVHLIDGTVCENITLGSKGELDHKRLENVCDKAALSEFILDKMHGMNSDVGENGSLLSGGQKQRVGFARALYHDKEIIILDEATSALDTKTEALVLQSIKELAAHKTVIFITHKVENLQFADRLILMKKGEVLAQGSYSELLEYSPDFLELLNNNKEQLVE